MFGIGAPELMLILGLALIIVGPQKLPELGRTLGQTMAAFKAQTDELRSVMNFDAPATTPTASVTSHFPTTGAQAYGAAAEQFLANGQPPVAETEAPQVVRYAPSDTSSEAQPVTADIMDELKPIASK